MPQYVVERTLGALEVRGVTLEGARVLVLGLAYKPNVDSLHESPAIGLLQGFAERGLAVRYSDPWMPRAPGGYEAWLEAPESLALDDEVVAGFDAVVLCTDHDAFDYEEIARSARLVVDTRNAFGALLAGDPRYVRA